MIKKIKIGSHIYDIELKDLENEEASGGSGYTFPTFNKIVINSRLPQSQQESTLIHEIIEIINYQNQLELEHNKIMTLEAGLYQALKDNKLIFN